MEMDVILCMCVPLGIFLSRGKYSRLTGVQTDVVICDTIIDGVGVLMVLGG